MRSVRFVSLCAALAALPSACALERADQARSPNPVAGLYTPDSRLGALDPSDLEAPVGALGDRCAMLPEVEGMPTDGTLELDYMTQTVGGQYGPANVTAVWIEDAAQNYVTTLEVRAQLRRPGLRCFNRRACKQPELWAPDVVTSASLRDHDTPHNLEWDGMDGHGQPAADGDYVLFIEVTETDKADGDCLSYPFTKGPVGFEQPLLTDDGTALQSGTMRWEPSGGGQPQPDADAGT